MSALRAYPSLFQFIVIISLLAEVAILHAADAPGQHPAYRSYDFGNQEKVVRFGTQPLGVLSCVVPEVMKRDRILLDYLGQRSIEFRPLPFYNGPDINHFMLHNKIDIAMAGDFPTLSMATQSDIQVVAIAKRDKAAVVTSDRFATILDLRGRRIAFPEGTSSHLGLLVVMEAAGLRESDVKMVPMNIEKLTGALVAGEIDAFAGWEPVPSAARALHPNLRIISQFLNTDFLYWTREFGEGKTEIARHVLAAYFRAIYWLNMGDDNLTMGARWSLAEVEQFLGKQSKLSLAEYKERIRENLSLAGSAAIPANEFDDGSFINRAFMLLKSKGKLDAAADWNRVSRSLRAELADELHKDPAYRIRSFDYIME